MHQTQTFLMRRFAEVGIRPKAFHGQNFLIDGNLLRLLVSAADINSGDVVLEVGGGTGALTGLLAQRAAAVISVEIDPQLAQLAREELSPFDNVTLLQVDALKNKHRMQPVVLDTIAAKRAEGFNRRFKLAANLPYNVATPIISNLLEGPHVPDSMTVTLQKELADRIAAVPGTKDYSALSVWVQCQCDVSIVRVLSPSVFWPRPKVHSAIVHIKTDFARRAQVPDLDGFHLFARAMFFHRRKFLRSVLIHAVKSLDTNKNEPSKSDIDDLLAHEELDPSLRVDQLDVPRMIRLFEAFRVRFPADVKAAGT